MLYATDNCGNLIMDRKCEPPPLTLEKSEEMPILGIPIMAFTDEKTQLVGKKNSDRLWQIFSKMILNCANFSASNK